MLPSPPSRRRGLKSLRTMLFRLFYVVASFSEAWIEIPVVRFLSAGCFTVASFSEAWIEIIALAIAGEPLKSPPSRRRGLKYL